MEITEMGIGDDIFTDPLRCSGKCTIRSALKNVRST